MSRSALEFGVNLNNREPLIAPDYTITDLLDLAEVVESRGFDSVWVGDSLFSKPRYEALSLLSAISQRTSRVRLGTACIVQTTRNPLYLALEWGHSRRHLARSHDLRHRFSATPRKGFVASSRRWVSTSSVAARSSRRDCRRFASYGQRARPHSKASTSPTTTSRSSRGPRRHRSCRSRSRRRCGSSRTRGLIREVPSEKLQRQLDRVCRRIVSYGDGWMTCCRATRPDELAEQIELIQAAADDLGVDLSSFVVSYQVTMNLGDSEEEASRAFDEYISKYYPELSQAMDLSNWGPVGDGPSRSRSGFARSLRPA